MQMGLHHYIIQTRIRTIPILNERQLGTLGGDSLKFWALNLRCVQVHQDSGTVILKTNTAEDRHQNLELSLAGLQQRKTAVAK